MSLNITVGITGGTGFIGSNLAGFLADKGYYVECLTRSGKAPPDLKEQENLFFSRGDITDSDSIIDFVRRNQIIIHLAGKTRAADEKEFIKFNVTGTINLIESIKTENPEIRQIIIMSSQAAVGPSPNEIFLDENSPLKPLSPYGRSKAMMENYLKSKSENLPITIVRAPSVYGPRDKDFLKLFRIYNMGIKPVIGKTHRISFVYVQNLIEGIFAMMSNKQSLNETFFITDGGALTWKEFGELSEKYLGKKAVTLNIPKFIVEIVGFISKVVSILTKKQILLTKDKLKEIKTPFWLVSNKKIKKLIGYTPQFSTEEGIQYTIRWYRDNHLLK